jgi:hypothetical protein
LQNQKKGKILHVISVFWPLIQRAFFCIACV